MSKYEKKKDTAPKKRISEKTDTQTKEVLKVIWHYVCMFKGLILSLPILGVSIWQAFENAARLPEEVGINLLATGEFTQMVPRSTAVLVPLLVTIVCVVLTSLSKRTLFPWLISLFTLVLPILIWITNIYPA